MPEKFEFPVDKNAVIYVEMQQASGAHGTPGVEQTADVGEVAAKVVEKADKALDASMDTIHHMIRRVRDVVESVNLMDRPTTIELEFGLKLEGEAGAFIAKAGVEATMNVKLVWERDKIAALNQGTDTE